MKNYRTEPLTPRLPRNEELAKIAEFERERGVTRASPAEVVEYHNSKNQQNDAEKKQRAKRASRSRHKNGKQSRSL